MIRRPPRSTRTDTLCPYTTLFRSGPIDVRINRTRALELIAGGRMTARGLEAEPRAGFDVQGWARVRPLVPESAIRLHQEVGRSEEHTSELQSLMRISYAVFCLKKQPTTLL